MINFVSKFYNLYKFRLNFFFNSEVDKKFMYLPSSNLNLIVKVKLSNIKYFLPIKHIKDKKFFFWKTNYFKNKKLIRNYSKYNRNYKSIFQIFKNKKDFRTSAEYIDKVSQLKKNGVTARGHTSIEEIDLYFNGLFKLYKDMKKKGYMPQKKLPINLRSDKIGDEIGVFLGPDGEIVKAEDKFRGTHRFALAKILKLKYVYINIRAIDLNFAKKKIFKNISFKDNETKIFEKIKLFLKRYE